MYTVTRSITLKCGAKVNVKLIIKEEDKKIIGIVDEKTCGIGYVDNIVRDCIFKFFSKSGLCDVIFTYETNMYKKLSLCDYYRTIATCDPRDTWDERKGVEIVLYKMKYKLDSAVSKRLALFYEKLLWNTKKFADNFFGEK